MKIENVKTKIFFHKIKFHFFFFLKIFSVYVDKYIDFILNQSVAHQFDSFAQGFLSVCSGPILEVSKPFFKTDFLKLFLSK